MEVLGIFGADALSDNEPPAPDNLYIREVVYIEVTVKQTRNVQVSF